MSTCIAKDNTIVVKEVEKETIVVESSDGSIILRDNSINSTVECTDEIVEITEPEETLKIVDQFVPGPKGDTGNTGPAGADGLGSPILHTVPDVSVDFVLDSLASSSVFAVKWILAIDDPSTLNRRSFLEINSVNLGSTLKQNKNNILGHFFDIKVCARLNGSNINLYITNNETFNLSISVIRWELNLCN